MKGDTDNDGNGGDDDDDPTDSWDGDINRDCDDDDNGDCSDDGWFFDRRSHSLMHRSWLQLMNSLSLILTIRDTTPWWALSTWIIGMAVVTSITAIVP